jgi:hypothetical protein
MAMAVCFQAEGEGDIAAPLACYGAPALYPMPQTFQSQVSPEHEITNAPAAVSFVPQSPVSYQLAEPVQFWQAGPSSNNAGNASAEWPMAQAVPQGGMAMVAAGGNGWVAGEPLPMLPRHNGSVNGTSSLGPQTNRLKKRFCTSFPEVQMCRRGASCAFAHSRDEIRAPLLSLEEEAQDPMAMTDDFFMCKYKTLWCPIGVQHEWHTCVYAHNYQDARRPVSIGYGAKLCPYWSKKDTGAEYAQRCPLGLRCPYAHGAKEQLYHPQYFKTVICRDLRLKSCPRQGLCAFFHNRSERRTASANDDIDYSQPLPEEALNAEWIEEFLTPPFVPEASKGPEDGAFPENGIGNMAMAMAPYVLPQAPTSPYAMQQPYVFLLPYPAPQISPQQTHQMAPQLVSPMGSPMNNQMPTQIDPGSPMNNNNSMNSPVANWVFVPLETSLQASGYGGMASAAN